MHQPGGTPFSFIDRHSAVILVLLTWVTVVWLIINPHVGFDIWWHILIGQEIVFEQIWPAKDTFTYTIPGKEYVIHSWLSDCLFAVVYEARGEAALQAVRIIVLLTYAFVIHSFVRSRTSSLPLSAVVTVMAVYLVHDRSVRPYIFPPLLAALLIQFSGDPRPVRRVLKELSIVIVWANLHPSFPFGMALLVYLEWTASQDGPWYTASLVFCLSLFIAGWLQPQGMKGLLYPFRALQFPTFDWSSSLDLSTMHATPTGIFFSYIIAGALSVTPLLVYLLERRPANEVVRIVFALLILVLSLIARRFAWFLIVTTLLCVSSSTHVLRRLKPSPRLMNWCAISACLLLACMKIEYRPQLYRDPVDAIDFMRQCDAKGNGFVFMPWAGRVLHDLNQNVRVFIDTRIEPFLPTVYSAYMAVMLESPLTPGILSSTDILMVPNSRFRPVHLDIGKDWIRVWCSVNETIYVRNNRSNSPLLARIARLYESKGIPFEYPSGFSVIESFKANPKWTVTHLFQNMEKEANQILGVLQQLSRKTAKGQPKCGDLWLRLGTCFVQTRMFPEALRCFEESLASSSSNKVELALARALFACGMDLAALNEIKRILYRDPHNIAALEVWLSYAIRQSHQNGRCRVFEENITVVQRSSSNH